MTQINYKRLMINTLATFVGGVIIGFVLLVLVYLLPVDPMRDNVMSSIEEWNEEGPWPAMIEGYTGSMLDNFTDSLMQSVAVFDSEESVFAKAMKNYYAMHPTIGAVGALYEYVHGDECFGESYARYWHGYLVVLKPLLMIFSYEGLRILNTVMLGLLVIIVTYLLSKHLAKGAGLVFFVTFLFLMPLTVFLCLDMANMLYVTLFALIILLQKGKYWKQGENVFLYFLAVGMLTSYVDFLTYPMITLGLPLVTYMALCMQDKRKNLTFPAVLSAGFWAVGYGGMWGAKWILASLITGENIVLNALRAVKQRSGLRDENPLLIHRLEVVETNVNVLFQGVGGYVLILLAMVLLACLIRMFLKKQMIGKGLWMFLAVATIPLVWLVITSEHARIHSWFTYRNLVASIYAIGMLGVCACSKRFQ